MVESEMQAGLVPGKRAAQGKASFESLSEANADIARITTGIQDLDNVLGGGLVPGALVLLGGEPGVGKSTLLLEIARRFEGKFLYFSGEESPGQIRIRATRLGVMSSNVQVSRETDLETIALEIEKHKPDIAVIDSIQTVQSAGSSPGSPAILREAAFRW